MPDAVHLTAEDGIGALTPDDELREIELGGHVDWWLTNWEFSQLYTRPHDREQAGALVLVAQVAERTSRRGLPFPPEWWPPSALTPNEARLLRCLRETAAWHTMTALARQHRRVLGPWSPTLLVATGKSLTARGLAERRIWRGSLDQYRAADLGRTAKRGSPRAKASRRSCRAGPATPGPELEP